MCKNKDEFYETKIKLNANIMKPKYNLMQTYCKHNANISFYKENQNKNNFEFK